MNGSIQKRLDAVIKAQAERETTDFKFFRQQIDDDGALVGFVMLPRGRVVGVQEFFDEIEGNPETAYVPLEPFVDDPERTAYWEEIEAATPTLAEMMDQNAGRVPPTRPAKTPEEEERARLARRYEARMEAWEPFYTEMAQRVQANRAGR